MTPDVDRKAREKAIDEFLLRVGVSDPLENAESHGGYLGFEVPENNDNHD